MDWYPYSHSTKAKSLFLLCAFTLCLCLFKTTEIKDHSSSRMKCEKPGDGTAALLKQAQFHFILQYIQSYTSNTEDNFSLWDAPFEEVRKCPEQGSYLKSKGKRSNLAGGFNFNTANTTKPLSFQFYIPQSFTAGSSSIALPKVILGKRKITTELTETEQFIPTLPFLCKLVSPQLPLLLKVLLLLHQ